MTKNCELAIEILRKTNDGDDLHPNDLYLVECAVNGFLKEPGQAVFEQLHADVVSDAYASPFKQAYWGIENLRIDDVGYVYWKDAQVEHYTPGWCWGDRAHLEALELAEICKGIESEGLAVTGSEVWKRF